MQSRWLWRRLGAAEVARPDELLSDSDQSWNTILTMLRTATGVDFTHYRSSTLKRRILRRMALNRVEGAERYVAYMRSHPPELGSLYDDILINVTEFFRDGDLFETLKTNIFPRIAPLEEPPKQLRFWIPGCATGEEVYSVAIGLLEYLGDRIADTPLQIFATDISDRALDAARAGIYPDNIGQDVSIGYLNHTDAVVRLYLQETFTFRLLTSEASVALAPSVKA